MCERCSEPSFVKAEPLDAAEGAECEWPLGEEGGEFCDVDPEILVFERTVDEHLCGQCMTSATAILDEGLGDVLRRTGLVATNDFLPITTSESCDRCGAPARFAWVATSSTPMCRAHAEDGGWTPMT